MAPILRDVSNEEFDDYDEDDDDAPVPLDRREAALVRRDLEDLAEIKRVFAADGHKGVSLFCQDCLEEHFYGWDMLENNLRALLESGETPVHEPAYDPQPNEYVDWEYAQGYLDGMHHGDEMPLSSLAALGDTCPFCGGALPERGQQIAYCPACGTALASARIAQALLERGWKDSEVEELLRAAHVPPMRTLPRR
jgi:Family of unknown function (DUF5319)